MVRKEVRRTAHSQVSLNQMLATADVPGSSQVTEKAIETMDHLWVEWNYGSSFFYLSVGNASVEHGKMCLWF